MKSRLLRKAEVLNVSEPYFSDETVLEIIRNAGYGAYIDEYNRPSTGTGNNQQGYSGQWTKQYTFGSEIEFPMIYYTELYQFTKGGKVVTFLIAWRYDTEGNLSQADPIVTKKNIPASKVRARLSSGLQMKDGTTVLGMFSSYEKALEA